MRLLSDADIRQLPEDDIITQLCEHGVNIEANTNLARLQNVLSQTQRTRHLVLWHDHATVLGSGYILVTMHVLYDEAVYLSDQEYQERVGIAIHKGYVQHHIEEPCVYIMAAGSSSKEDQASLIPDQVECLSELAQTITAANGAPLQDVLRFFKGDSPPQQFE